MTSIMYIFRCTCKYCDENHVVLLEIYFTLFSKAQGNNVHGDVLAVLLPPAVAMLVYF